MLRMTGWVRLGHSANVGSMSGLPESGHGWAARCNAGLRWSASRWPLSRLDHRQRGVDLHFDWGASQFLTKQFQIGLVGYVYDGFRGACVGCHASRIARSAPLRAHARCRSRGFLRGPSTVIGGHVAELVGIEGG